MAELQLAIGRLGLDSSMATTQLTADGHSYKVNASPINEARKQAAAARVGDRADALTKKMIERKARLRTQSKRSGVGG